MGVQIWANEKPKTLREGEGKGANRGAGPNAKKCSVVLSRMSSPQRDVELRRRRRVPVHRCGCAQQLLSAVTLSKSWSLHHSRRTCTCNRDKKQNRSLDKNLEASVERTAASIDRACNEIAYIGLLTTCLCLPDSSGRLKASTAPKISRPEPMTTPAIARIWVMPSLELLS